jgi:hypothetical protein
VLAAHRSQTATTPAPGERGIVKADSFHKIRAALPEHGQKTGEAAAASVKK